MDYVKREHEFYENKWGLVFPSWKKEKKPYLKKEAGVEGRRGLELIKNHISHGVVLDIGCGGGRNSVLFAKAGFTVFGIDFSEKAVCLAKINAKEQGVAVTFGIGDALKLRYDNDYFDAVLDFGLFHHLRKSQYEKYIKNVIRVLKCRGYYLLYCFSTESEKTSRYESGKRNWALFNGHIYHYFSKEEITKIFSKEFNILNYELIKEEGRKLAFNLVLLQKK
ncbi:Ubiquinone biosynthesis O-methyltransferase [Candidatus Tiddalikarchaeum anstoanum]|nr:Ubiquinone biosynthesis O-methyltransferase [Candidatus Tiddalikarchaeum anstoanum]